MISFYHENRLAKMLRLFEYNNALSPATLSSKLNVSTKTIQNDVKKLNDTFQGAAIIHFKQGVYTLFLLESNNLETIYLTLCKEESIFSNWENRLTYIIYKLLSSSGGYTMEELAEEMIIGRSTLVGDMKRLREELSPYELAIVGKPKEGLFLQGEELQIRMYILEHLYTHIYNATTLDEEILRCLTEAGEANGLSIKTIEQVQKYLTISLDRFLTQHPLNHVSLEEETLGSTKGFLFINQLVDKLEKNLHIKLPKQERLFLTLPILGMQTSFGQEPFAQVSKECKTLGKEVLNHIEEKMNITLDTGDLFEDFVQHICFMLNRVKYNIPVENPLKDDVKEKYPMAYQIAEMSKVYLETTQNLRINEEEIGFLAMYFGVFLNYSTQEQYIFDQVLVVCHTGKVTARMIESQLRRILYPHTEIHVVSEEQVTHEIVAKYPLIFSTIPLDIHPSPPIVYVKNIFSQEELRKKIQQLPYQKKANLPLQEGLDSLLLGSLKEENLFVLPQNQSYFSHLKRMADVLVERNQVDQEFYCRIQDRENASTMIFESHIAIPHTIHHHDELVLSLGLVEFPLGEEEPNLIFLLGIPENFQEEEHILLKLYDEIIDIANRPAFVQQLAKQKNYKELVLSFIQESRV